MTLFFLKIGERKLKLKVVNTQDINDENQIIIYESVGSSGGWNINTGRLTQTVVLTGKLLADTNSTDEQIVREILSQQIEEIQDIKDLGTVVRLISPITSNKVNQFIIKNFNYTIPEGASSYVNFTMTLIENRKASSTYSSASLVGQEAEKQLLIEKSNERAAGDL